MEFRLIEQQQGRQGTPVFVTRIVIEGLDGESGRGYSKKESHQQAAKATLQTLKTDKQFVAAIYEARDARLTPPAAAEEEQQQDTCTSPAY